MIPSRLLLALATLGLAAPFVHAVDWKSKSVDVTAKPGRDVVFTTFDFTNSGKSVVHVLGITTTCGCTDASANPNDVQPGQSGTIQVVFEIGKRTGVQEREILVQTDDTKEPTHLKLRVTIPDPAKKVASTATPSAAH